MKPAISVRAPSTACSLHELDPRAVDGQRSVIFSRRSFTDCEVVRARNSLAAEAIYGRDSQSRWPTRRVDVALGGTVDQS